MTDTKIEKLQEAVINELYLQVTEGTVVKDDEGNATKLSPSPALLKVAMDAVKAFKDDNVPRTGALSSKLQQYANRDKPGLVPGSAMTN